MANTTADKLALLENTKSEMKSVLLQYGKSVGDVFSEYPAAAAAALAPIENKADKVSGATEGNFASLDSTGNLVDSGKKPSDFAAAGLSRNVTLYVNASSGNDSNDGLSSSKAKKTVQAALNSLPKNLGSNEVTLYIQGNIVDTAKIQVSGFYNGSIIIQSINSDKVSSPVAFSIKFCTANILLAYLRFQMSKASNTALVEIESCYFVGFVECDIDAVNKVAHGVNISGQTNVGFSSCDISNCNRAINVGSASGRQGITSISLYEVTGSNNAIGVRLFFAVLGVYSSTLTGDTQYAKSGSLVLE